MSNINVKKLIEERKQLLEELSNLDHLLHGSWLERYSTCSRKNCKCHSGELHGPRYYLVVNKSGRQKQNYIPVGQKKAAMAGVKQGNRMLEIVEAVTQINLQLLKEGVYDDGAK
ncbi:MAG: DUF6788 family protein [Bacteroidales bacterium]|jgi:hypothetical protein